MVKRYRVTLNQPERDELEQLIRKGKSAAQKLAHARILLLADESANASAYTDQQIAEPLNVFTRTIERVRQRLVEQGFEAALVPAKGKRIYGSKLGGKVGAPLRKPEEVMGDRGYDSDPHRMQLSCRAIPALIARRNTPNGSGLGIFRYVVEQSLALFHQFRRLRTRFDKRDDIHEAFMTLGCAMMCWRRLHRSKDHF